MPIAYVNKRPRDVLHAHLLALLPQIAVILLVAAVALDELCVLTEAAS